jgi:acetyl esterase/lipase
MHWLLLFALVGITLSWPGPGNRAAAAPEPKATPVLAGGEYEVEVVRDLPYYAGSDADPVKHKLDLYLPKGAKDFPVLFFVHGGAWRHGDKRILFDVHGKVGRIFARNGIGAVVTNYRLTPQVQHPKHVEDVARAFAWTHQNVAKYGGRPDQIFVSGHSAGGHLAALLATAPQYLQAHDLTLASIKGVLPISGVYEIAPLSFFDPVFGTDLEVRKAASPTYNVKGAHPPFLITYADGDFPFCDVMSKGLAAALARAGVEAECLEVKGRDHVGILVHLSHQEDPAFQAMLGFVARHAGLKLTAGMNAAAR